MAINYPYKYRDFSFGAAEAVLEAGDQGKYWEMHDLLLERSPDLKKERLIEMARELNLDIPRFTKSLETMKHKDAIDADVKRALDMDLYSTPTFFINGRKVVGAVPYPYLKRIVEEELEHGGKK